MENVIPLNFLLEIFNEIIICGLLDSFILKISFENSLSSTSTSTSITTPTSPLSSLINNNKNPMKPRTKALNFDPVHRPRRQDWKGDLVENGMLYFAKRDLIENEQVLQGGKCSYIEVPTTLSIEIDSSLDLAHAEQTVVHEGLLPFLI